MYLRNRHLNWVNHSLGARNPKALQVLNLAFDSLPEFLTSSFSGRPCIFAEKQSVGFLFPGQSTRSAPSRLRRSARSGKICGAAPGSQGGSLGLGSTSRCCAAPNSPQAAWAQVVFSCYPKEITPPKLEVSFFCKDSETQIGVFVFLGFGAPSIGVCLSSCLKDLDPTKWNRFARWCPFKTKTKKGYPQQRQTDPMGSFGMVELEDVWSRFRLLGFPRSTVQGIQHPCTCAYESQEAMFDSSSWACLRFSTNIVGLLVSLYTNSKKGTCKRDTPVSGF